MKNILVSLVLILVPISSAAQESGRPSIPDDYCKDSIFLELCNKIVKQAQNAEKTGESVQELKKTLEELRSADKDQQAKGVIDAAKNLNSNANNNRASEAVTEKSLSLVDQLQQRESELLRDSAKGVQSGLAPSGAPSSFNAGQQHQLNEPARGVEQQQLSLEQQLRGREEELLSSRPISPAASITKSAEAANETHQLTLEDQLRQQQAKLLSSPTTVKRVADADRAIEAAAKERIAEEKRQEAARRAEIAKQRQAEAEATRLAAIVKKEQQEIEDAWQAKKEAREAAIEAAAQRAAFEAMYGPPPNQAVPYVPHILGVPSLGSSYSPPSVSTYSPTPAFGSSYIGQPPANSTYTTPKGDAGSCMNNLLTEYSCLEGMGYNMHILSDLSSKTPAPSSTSANNAQSPTTPGGVSSTGSASTPTTPAQSTPASVPKTAP